jgi:hypothetical protein
MAPEERGLLSQLVSFGGRSMGRIVIRGRQVDEIELKGHFHTDKNRFGGGSSLDSVDVDYILHGDVKGKKKLLEAKLSIKRTGIIHRKVLDLHWEGGVLAEKLKGDSSINELLWQSVGQLSARDLEVKIDEKDGAAIIHVRDDQQVYRGTLPPFQLYEKIAEHARALIGNPTTSITTAPKAVVPPPAPNKVTAVPQVKPPPGPDPEPPAKTREVRFCVKCGAGINLNAAFCPKCGAKQH